MCVGGGEFLVEDFDCAHADEEGGCYGGPEEHVGYLVVVRLLHGVRYLCCVFSLIAVLNLCINFYFV